MTIGKIVVRRASSYDPDVLRPRHSSAEAARAGCAHLAVGGDRRRRRRSRSRLRESRDPETGLSPRARQRIDEKQAFDETFEKFFEFPPFSGRNEAGAPQHRVTRRRDGSISRRRPGRLSRRAGRQGGQADGSGGGRVNRGPVAGVRDQSAGRRRPTRSNCSRAATAPNCSAVWPKPPAARVTDIRFFTQRGMYGLRIQREMGSERSTIDRGSARFRRSGRAAIGGERLRACARISRGSARLCRAAACAVRRQRRTTVARGNSRERAPVGGRAVDMKLMHELVRKMAKRLVSLHSRRRKTRGAASSTCARRSASTSNTTGCCSTRSGRSARSTAESDGDLRRVRLGRAGLALSADVPLIRCIDVIPNVRSFAFSGQLGEVTDLFETMDVERAIAETLDRFGGSTDYGEAFETFESCAWTRSTARRRC